MTPKVVIQYDTDGIIKVFADEGVDVFSLDECCPDDRTYKMTPEPIPSGMIDAEFGHKGDGSRYEIRMLRAENGLSVVEGGKPDEKTDEED